jgi:phage-related protein
MKAALFHPAALAAIRSFPEEVRRELGKLLYDVQMEARLGMPQSRPMPSVAPGIEELRVRDRSGVYRAFYYSKSARGVSRGARLHEEEPSHGKAGHRNWTQAVQGDGE